MRNGDSVVSAVLDLFSNCKVGQAKRERYYDSFIYMATSFHLSCSPKGQSAQTSFDLAPTGQHALHQLYVPQEVFEWKNQGSRLLERGLRRH